MGATADPAGKGDGEARELREVILAALHDAWIAGGGAIQQTDALLVALPRNGFEVAPAGTTDALAAERKRAEVAEHFSLDSFQQNVTDWARAKWPHRMTVEKRMVKMMEELGELADAIRACDDDGLPLDNAHLADEVGDCLIVLLSLAEVCGVSALSAAVSKVRRVWGADPDTLCFRDRLPAADLLGRLSRDHEEPTP